MSHTKQIDHSELVDPQSLLDRGECPYTFLAFPASAVDENGLPTDLEARQYIARVQSEGVPIGIWLNTPVEDTGYAFVGPENIEELRSVLQTLEKAGVYSSAFASDLSERLLRR
ncbi:hypothetical protein [Roseiconus lacunae]|uniref:hypothetical protein n=1 Tax=Roseiconus lacunae TaxID=2605694 RepID=UPI001E32CD4A|nr:hypothetical protein [Roseiconus lacunae]MCD0462305.1 hypothetical protein [Roseiconus lacunae]